MMPQLIYPLHLTHLLRVNIPRQLIQCPLLIHLSHLSKVKLSHFLLLFIHQVSLIN